MGMQVYCAPAPRSQQQAEERQKSVGHVCGSRRAAEAEATMRTATELPPPLLRRRRRRRRRPRRPQRPRRPRRPRRRRWRWRRRDERHAHRRVRQSLTAGLRAASRACAASSTARVKRHRCYGCSSLAELLGLSRFWFAAAATGADARHGYTIPRTEPNHLCVTVFYLC